MFGKRSARLQTNAAVFRYGSEEEISRLKCQENEVLQTYYTKFKIVEGLGCLFSLSAVILVLIFWEQTAFDASSFSTDIQLNQKEFYDQTKFTLKYTQYLNSKTLNQEEQKDETELMNTLINQFSNTPRYPASVYLTDFVNVRIPKATSSDTVTKLQESWSNVSNIMHTTCNKKFGQYEVQ